MSRPLPGSLLGYCPESPWDLKRKESLRSIHPIGLQPYPQKVVRPPKPNPTTFSGGGWSPRDKDLRKCMLPRYMHPLYQGTHGPFISGKRTQNNIYTHNTRNPSPKSFWMCWVKVHGDKLTKPLKDPLSLSNVAAQLRSQCQSGTRSAIACEEAKRFLWHPQLRSCQEAARTLNTEVLEVPHDAGRRMECVSFCPSVVERTIKNPWVPSLMGRRTDLQHVFTFGAHRYFRCLPS